MLAISLTPTLHPTLAAANVDAMSDVTPAAVEAMPGLEQGALQLDYDFLARLRLSTIRLHLLLAPDKAHDWEKRIGHLSIAVAGVMSLAEGLPRGWGTRQPLLALLLVVTAAEVLCALLAAHAQRLLPSSSSAERVARLLAVTLEPRSDITPLLDLLRRSRDVLRRVSTDEDLLLTLYGEGGDYIPFTATRLAAVDGLAEELRPLGRAPGARDVPVSLVEDLQAVAVRYRRALGM